ncbi:conserved hypothetical protein [Verticillium alfalfae VaMs.102]|uniref:Cell wall biogenesis protein Mhp1 n=1 Tax=Verticillium alfalfae (strain VaMs.102 / ATCC MYA-4576 / FGSC 10136) TaxID=526221 RepID=C9SGS3_VERA1|nr:conserved hypothetical protein [Verticillium alfalfae VaMs.102]EEY18167.1 conserved hypothetical protein [Verticillium alfalfae VaMs.102]
MEHVHGVDVSWMTHGSPKDKGAKNTTTRPITQQQSRETPRSSPASVGSDAPSPTSPTSPVAATSGSSTNGNTVTEDGALPKSIPTTRPGVRRTESSEKPGPNGTPPHRRNSWFSSISSKFSSSPNPSTTAPSSSPTAQPPQTTPPKDTTPAPPKAVPSRNAVLQHATKPDGDLPYTPAPPSRGQSSFLGVFRRLSSSGGALHNSQRGNHGLVERKILNVDRNRERCAIAALHQAKLRRVAFSVDVEIAPMPKYTDAENGVKSTVPADKSTKRKLTEKGEGEALKNPKTIEEQKEQEGVMRAYGLFSLDYSLPGGQRAGDENRLLTLKVSLDKVAFVERLVLKNNKLGVDGWKHTCLFIYLCRTLRHLDLSMVPLPRPVSPKTHPGHRPLHLPHLHHQSEEITLASLFSKAVGQRLAGSNLELLHIGGIEPTSEELGTIIDGVIECGVKRLGLAHNNIDDKGLEHVARWVTSGNCVGLDLGGNDLRENLEVFANAISSDSPLWGLSLAECNLRAGTLCKILPKLNGAECHQPTSKLENLRRIHLADVAMSSEQAIALAEILPEVQNLAHISFLENPDLVNLADAQTEESQEEACALYASLLAATRVSNTMVCVDIDVPSERSGEIVKAMAKQVVAYCLRNLQRFPIAEISSAVQALSDGQDAPAGQEPPYPDVLAHLVGHDVLNQDEVASDDESAPDDDYVIGGTGVVKALTCCLKNRGDESRRQSGEFIREVEGGITLPAIPQPRLPHGKAKVMSKHLLASARKIRVRLQPAIARAKNNASDEENYRKLMFLDTTLANIIKRFEDEFPDTRVDESTEQTVADAASAKSDQLGTSLSSELDPEQIAIPSDPEDDLDLQVRPSVSRSNSIMSHTSRALADEEGRILRAGHKFRSGIIKPEHYGLLNSPDELSFEPKHEASMLDMVEELDDPELSRKAKEKGIIRLFREDRVEISEALRRVDPEYWERFVESQEKARGNVQVSSVTNGGAKPAQGDESAVVDDA